MSLYFVTLIVASAAFPNVAVTGLPELVARHSRRSQGWSASSPDGRYLAHRVLTRAAAA